MIHTNFLKQAAALGTAAAIALGASTVTHAAPVDTGNAALHNAAPGQVVDVYYRHGWRRGGYVAAGVGLGILGAAVIANSARPYYYYDAPYGGPVYYNDYDEGSVVMEQAPPVQFAPAYRPYPRSCWVQTSPYGHGYRTYC